MDDSPVREQLKQAVACIRTGDLAAAQQILRPLCAANYADAWWLVAQTTKNPEQIQFALRKALQCNPQHERAAQQLKMLNVPKPPEPDNPPVAAVSAPVTPPAPPRRSLIHSFPSVSTPEISATEPEEIPTIDERKRKDEAQSPRKRKEKEPTASSGKGLRLLLVVVTGIFVGLAATVFFTSLTYTVPPPTLGPYYMRYSTGYAEVAPAPCDSFLVFGTIKENAGLTAHFWLGDYDAQTVPDASGNFQQIIPRNIIAYQYEAGNHYPADYPLRLQLLDAAGNAQSGINRLYFGRGCAVYVEYWRENWSGLKIGNRAARPPAWDGPYEVAFSEFTTSPLVICDFTGFIGTAYDDYGPISGIFIQISDVDKRGDLPEYFVTSTGVLDVQMGPSGWLLFAEPDHRYLLQVTDSNGMLYAWDVIYLPPKQGCEKNLIKVSITQADGRANPPPLPAEWDKS